MLLAFKLLATPLLIGSVTLASRRWGPNVAGLFIGLPLTSGPISLILALNYGPEFASRAAVASLVGEISVCIFCLAYSLTSARHHWPASAAIGISSFLIATALWNQFSWSLPAAFLLLLAVIWLVSRWISGTASAVATSQPPAWDLPARMLVAAGFVILLTTSAQGLGPQLSGLLSPFPVFGVVLASFTHHQQGPAAAAGLLRGVVIGSLAYGGFFLMAGVCLTRLPLGWTYLLAIIAALGFSGLSFYLTRSSHSSLTAG